MKRIFRNTIVDILIITISLYLSILIRFEFKLEPKYMNYSVFIVFILVKLFIYFVFRFHLIIWAYSNIIDLFKIIFVSLLSNSILVIINYMKFITLPRSVFVISALLDILIFVIAKFYHKIKMYFVGRNIFKTKKILIVGAGEAGSMLIDDINKNNNFNYEIVGLIDDDKEKSNRIINGIEVIGNTKNVKKIIENYSVDEVVLAIPSIDKQSKMDLIDRMDIPINVISTVPSLKEIVEKRKNIEKIGEINISDLLGREEIVLDNQSIKKMFKNKVVLISGGGGSIGSELARQVASMDVKQLILVDIYENNVYDVQNEILNRYTDIDLKVLIESVRDKKRMDDIFNEYKPNIVLHAAAHKHVPLMEVSPQSAVLNNVFGTNNIADAAHKNNVDVFLQISTDKAVNPTNVMGATKRIDEMIINSYNSISSTKFSCVRFGNVLGSNGSVVPLFKRQIESGGPVTVTNENITRFFMTIPEACSLVLETATKSKGGEIFVLDMGDPVKIIDLAKKMIKLMGYKVGEDIEIKITGLRPGEKLYEEILVDLDNAIKTDNKKIFVEENEEFDYEIVQGQLENLKKVVSKSDDKILIKELEMIVPTFNHKTNV